MAPETFEWKKRIEDYKKLWIQLSSSIKGSAIDPISLDCSLPINDICEKAIIFIEGINFSYIEVSMCYRLSVMVSDWVSRSYGSKQIE